MNNWGFTVDNPKKDTRILQLTTLFNQREKCDLVSLKVNDLYLNDDLSIANCMNSYFSLVFTVEEHENFPYNIFVLPLKLKNC